MGFPSRMAKSLAHWAVHNSSWKQSVFHSQVWYVNTSYCGNSSATLSCQSESGIDASSFKVTEARDESFQKYSLESKHANTHIHAEKSWDGVILATWFVLFVQVRVWRSDLSLYLFEISFLEKGEFMQAVNSAIIRY